MNIESTSVRISNRFVAGGGCFASVAVIRQPKQWEMIYINARAVSRVLRIKRAQRMCEAPVERGTWLSEWFESIFVFDSEIADAISIDEHIIDESIELRSIDCGDGGRLFIQHIVRLLWRDKWKQQKDVKLYTIYSATYFRSLHLISNCAAVNDNRAMLRRN